MDGADVDKSLMAHMQLPGGPVLFEVRLCVLSAGRNIGWMLTRLSARPEQLPAPNARMHRDACTTCC